jgi:hypothetical protein
VSPGAGRDRVEAKGSWYQSGRSRDWVKAKNPKAPAVTRLAEDDRGVVARLEAFELVTEKPQGQPDRR